MTDTHTPTDSDETERAGARQRAIDAYDSARDRLSTGLGEAPLIALAGGLAAGALIAALLPRTDSESRLVRPTARRVKNSARAAYDAARETGSERLGELGLTREKGEQTIRSLLDGVTEAARASAKAAADAVKNQR